MEKKIQRSTYSFIYRLNVLGGIFLFIGAVGLGYTNCSDVVLERRVPSVSASAIGEFCIGPDDETVFDKFLFVVDKSGSNRRADPNNVRRADNIERFLNQHRDNPYVKWGFIQFGQSQAVPVSSYIMDPNTGEPGFSNAFAMDEALGLLRSEADAGCTPYMPALALSKQVIREDIQNYPEESSVYHVFFLSDGRPDPPSGGGGCGSATVTNSPTDPFLFEVRSLINLKPNKAFFHTVFYHIDGDPPASQGLRFMAEAGRGSFVDLEMEDQLDFNSFLGGEDRKSRILKGPRIVIKNLNAGFCLDGSIDVDSDADGLCDKDEIAISEQLSERLGGRRLSPTNRHSVDAKFSDKFVYEFGLLRDRPMPQCTFPNSDEDFDLLNPCEETLLRDLDANGPTIRWTEELLARGGTANPKNPDSSGNGFLDGLQFFQFGTPSSAVNFLNLRDRYAGGFSGEDLMVEHRHPRRPDVFNEHNYDARTVFVEKRPTGENCYSFTQTQLALYPTLEFIDENRGERAYDLSHKAGENVILMYYISVPEDDPNGYGILHYSFQKLNYNRGEGIGQLRFDQFEKYEVPLSFGEL